MSFLFHVGDVLVGGKEPIDDSVDKIHRKCTIVFLLLLSLPLFTKQFAGEPIECFTPTYFTDAQSRYVNSYCWTVSTFYHTTSSRPAPASSTPSSWDTKEPLVHVVDYDEFEHPDSLPSPQQQQRQETKTTKFRTQTKVNYYQWAPMILLGKAVTFYLPFALWKILAQTRGISLRMLMKRVSVWSKMGPSHPDRSSMLQDIVDMLHLLMVRPDFPPPGDPDCISIDCSTIWNQLGGPRQQSRLFVTFLIIKVLYFINLFLQFYLLVSFLGDDYLTHGWDILAHLWNKSEWWASPRFPLQTLCSVRAAQQGSLRQYQCHCVLPINLFNEKICSIWWFYVALLMPVTVAGIINWCVRSTIECRIKFVQHYLWKTSHVPMDYAEASRWFVLDYLGHDGVFLLRLIEINHGSSVVTTIVDLLYARYVHNLSQQHPTESPVLSTFDMQDIPGPPGPATGQQPQVSSYHQGQVYPSPISRLARALHPKDPGRHSLAYFKPRGLPERKTKSRRSLQIHPSAPASGVA